MVQGKIKSTVVEGRCWSSDQGGVRIEVFAGSIRAAAGGGYLERPQAASVLLHEVGHGKKNHQMQIGAWFDRRLSRRDHEVGAEEFVAEACRAHADRLPKKSWKNELAQRRALNK